MKTIFLCGGGLSLNHWACEGLRALVWEWIKLTVFVSYSSFSYFFIVIVLQLWIFNYLKSLYSYTMNRVLISKARLWRCGLFASKSEGRIYQSIASYRIDGRRQNASDKLSSSSSSVHNLLPNTDCFVKRHIGPRDNDKTSMLETIGFRVI